MPAGEPWHRSSRSGGYPLQEPPPPLQESRWRPGDRRADGAGLPLAMGTAGLRRQRRVAFLRAQRLPAVPDAAPASRRPLLPAPGGLPGETDHAADPALLLRLADLFGEMAYAAGLAAPASSLPRRPDLLLDRQDRGHLLSPLALHRSRELPDPRHLAKIPDPRGDHPGLSFPGPGSGAGHRAGGGDDGAALAIALHDGDLRLGHRALSLQADRLCLPGRGFHGARGAQFRSAELRPYPGFLPGRPPGVQRALRLRRRRRP